MTIIRGRNFLHTPGPTNIPERILRAMHRPAVEFSGPEFIEMVLSCRKDLKPLFKTNGNMFIYAANGHGAWEAALANTLSESDTVLVPETGNFSNAWLLMAKKLGIQTVHIQSDLRNAINPQLVEDKLRLDTKGSIKAVLVVHTDTATSITSNIEAIRSAIDCAKHPALLMVDTIASLMTTDFQMDAWGVDVTIAAGQKGLMLPPGLSFTAASERAMYANKDAKLPRAYWDWADRLDQVSYRWFCGTPPEHLIFGLREAINMVTEEGFNILFKRHKRLAGAVHAAIERWSEEDALSFNAVVPDQRSTSVTTIRVNTDLEMEKLHTLCRNRFNVALGYGLAELSNSAFRIGHMGDLNEPMILGTLASIETTLNMLGVPYGRNGVSAAIDYLAQEVEPISKSQLPKTV